MSGNVSLATTDSVAEVFVIPGLKMLREHYPVISLTLFTSINIPDISYRSADMAIRAARPEEVTLIIKRMSQPSTPVSTSEKAVSTGITVFGR